VLVTRSRRRKDGPDSGAAGEYLIVVRGHLAEDMADWLGGMKINISSRSGEAPVTTLVGRLRDQAELRGIVETLHEFHFTILSVERLGD
jgi:hypothetical protein